ncbi:MAG: hypothetical protein WCI03_12825 [bacterium]
MKSILFSSCVGMSFLLTGCVTPPPHGGMDPEVKAAAEAAQAAFQRGEVARADTLYVKALARARLTDNRDEIVRNAYNLGLCRMISGQHGEARELLIQARILAGERGVIAARILLAESEAARLVGDGPGSEQFARQALAAGTDREGTAQAWLLQGEAWIQAGQLESAMDCCRSASKHITRDTPATVRARLNDLESGLVQARILPGSVVQLQLSRAEWLKKAGQFKDMVKALQAAALVLEFESKWEEAFDCRLRIALSLQAAGDVKQALSEARKASELAGQTGNVNNQKLIDSLLNELK